MEATNNDMTEQATTTEQATAPIGMAANTNEKNLNAMASEQSHEDTAALVDLATNPVASPEELSSYVDNLIQQLEGKFDEASEQIMGKLEGMAGRMEELERTMGDMLHSLGSSGDVTGASAMVGSAHDTNGNANATANATADLPATDAA